MADVPITYTPDQLLGSRVLATIGAMALPLEYRVLEIAGGYTKLQLVYGGEDPFWRESNDVDIYVLLPPEQASVNKEPYQWQVKQPIEAAIEQREAEAAKIYNITTAPQGARYTDDHGNNLEEEPYQGQVKSNKFTRNPPARPTLNPQYYMDNPNE